MGSGVREPGNDAASAGAEVECMARSEAATVAWVRSEATGCGLAWARSLPCGLVRRSVGSCGVRFALRKAVRRFVRRRGGVGWEMDMTIEDDKRFR
jgi:hypothetical protein